MSTKVVPLVVYSQGVRHQIGEATVDLETGKMTAQIDTLEITGSIGSILCSRPR